MKRVYHVIVYWPKISLLLALAATGFFAYHARALRIDSSVENLLAENDPNKQFYDEVRSLFGSDDMEVIGLVTDNVYTPATLEKIKRITAAVEKIDGVESVASLTNVPDPIADVVDPPLLIPRIPTDQAALDALRRKVEENPIYLNVVSRDGQGAAVLIFLKRLSEDEYLQKGIEDRLEEIVAREQGPEKLYLTGMQSIKVNSLRLMQQDLRTFTPLSLAVIMVVLGFCFRNLRGVLLPLFSVLCGVVWTLGIMVLTGEAITIGTLVLPSLLIVIGSTYSIYVIAQYEDETRRGGTPAEVVLRALTRVSLPVTVAAFTTVIGFVTLLVNRIATIRALGLYAAVGFASVTVIVLILIPAALALLPLPRRRVVIEESDWLVTLLAKVGQFNRQYQMPIIVTAGLLVIPCVWGIARIRADSNFIQYFKEDSPVRHANEVVGEKIGGTQNFEIIINSGKRGGATSFDLLERIKGLQTHLATLPGVDQTVSIVNYCELLDRAIQSGGSGEDIVVGDGGDPMPVEPAAPPSSPSTPITTFWERPEQLKAVMQLVNGSPKTFAAWLSPDFSTARVLVRTRLSSSSDIIAAAEEVRRYGRERFPPEVSVRPTGSLILLNEATEDIVWGQITSLGFALAVIFVVLSLMFLSMKVGILSLIPNLLAIFVLFGAMGWTGVTLNLGTSIIASIAIGIAVEDAIRYLARLSTEIQETHDQDQAIFQTISTVGKPIIYASTALGLGFLTLHFSNFVPIQKFGYLTAITIASAFVNDLVLLPALLATVRIITLWDVLYLRLGRDPHKTIRLFQGLRPFQAKVVVLMGELKTFPRAQPIVRKGEVGNEMFVLISGKADVLDPEKGGSSRLVRKLERGDVFGEMALVRHQVRTADVVATEDVEAVALNERFLVRVQRRYPRIGAKIFLNIARILSDRLEQETALQTAKAQDKPKGAQERSASDYRSTS